MNVNIPDGGQVYLHDKYLQTYTLMQPGAEYKFTISKDAASQGDQRFELSMNPASITEATNSMDVQMVPNPATSMVTVSYTSTSKEKTSVRIMNIEGVTVLSQDLGIQKSGNASIDLSGLASGVYMVELTSDDNKVVKRLMKE